MMQIPLIKPFITKEIKERVCKVLDSGYLTEGPVTKEFENIIKDYIGCEYTIAVTSCTTGLEIALRALGIGPGDEVIVPDYTYPATANVVAIVGAKIVLVDVLKESMLIDYGQIESAITKKTRAIIPVSIFGNPLDYDKLNSIKQKYNLHIVEDAACSIGSEYKNSKVGNHADISVFSLHPRKFITTGEGGIIITNNQEWAEWMLSYKHFGMGVDESRLTTSFDRIGGNYKMSNVLAAIGLGQMEHIEELLENRRTLSNQYISMLKEHKEIIIPETTPNGNHSYQSFCIYINQRDSVMKKMREAGIEVQIGTYALHMHPAFMPSSICKINGKLDGSVYAFMHCLTLPLYSDMTKNEQEYVVEHLLKML